MIISRCAMFSRAQMNTSVNSSSEDWSALLDQLKEREDISSDAKLAATLGVTRGYICSVRKGRKGLSLDLAQTVLSRLGRTFDTDSLERLFVPARVQLRTRNLTALKAYVVQRAKGHCQLCGCEAPFKDKNGDPYLEIHHAVPIRDGGSDSAENLIALCPNCHRKIHVSADPNDMKKLHRIAASYSAHD